MAEDSEIKKDDLEHRLDEIEIALGIQTTTTSSVLEDIKHKLDDLDQIKALLGEAKKRADTQWVYSIGFAAVIGSLAFLAVTANARDALIIALAGLALMVGAPYFARIRK